MSVRVPRPLTPAAAEQVLQLVRTALYTARDHEIACCDPTVDDGTRRDLEDQANAAYSRVQEHLKLFTRE